MDAISERLMKVLAPVGVAAALVFVAAFYFALTAGAVALGFYFLRLGGLVT